MIYSLNQRYILFTLRFVLAYLMLSVNPLAIAASGSDIYSLAENSLVAIETNHGFGSGVIIDNSGNVVTNYHVLRNASNVSILHGAMDKTYRNEAIRIIAADPIRDLVILSIKNFLGIPQGKRYLTRTNGSDQTSMAKIGSDIYALGYPSIKELKSASITNGIITGRNSANLLFSNRFTGSYPNNYLLYRISAKTTFGSSGGMLLDKEGRLIGITTGAIGKEEFQGFSVPIEYVNQALRVLESNPVTVNKYFWSKYDANKDKYYTGKLYSEVKNTENFFTIMSSVFDADGRGPIFNARIYFELENEGVSREYKRLTFADEKGSFQINLPELNGKNWYLRAEHDQYESSNKLGPFKQASDFPKVIELHLRKALRTYSAIMITVPPKIELLEKSADIKYKAIVYKGNELTGETVDWSISSIPQWIKVKPKPWGKVISAGQEVPIEFTFNKSVEDVEETSNATVYITNKVKNTELQASNVVVYANKLPDDQNLLISGVLLTELNARPMIKIGLRGYVDNNAIRLSGYADHGEFYLFTSKNKYADKSITLQIENPAFTVASDPQSQVVNEGKEWFTVIRLKRR